MKYPYDNNPPCVPNKQVCFNGRQHLQAENVQNAPEWSQQLGKQPPLILLGSKYIQEKTINPKYRLTKPIVRKRAAVVTADRTGLTEFSRFLGRPARLPIRRPKMKTEFIKRYSRKRSASRFIIIPRIMFLHLRTHRPPSNFELPHVFELFCVPPSGR